MRVIFHMHIQIIFDLIYTPICNEKVSRAFSSQKLTYLETGNRVLFGLIAIIIFNK